MSDKIIHVAILEDHQSVIDGYVYRLSQAADIQVAASALYGEDVEGMLSGQEVDVLVLDVGVKTGPQNSNIYPLPFIIPGLLERYPNLNIVIISMHAERPLIQEMLKAGASGYVLKDDQEAILDLAAVIRTIAAGGFYLSPTASSLLRKRPTSVTGGLLSARQLEAISLCAAYPDGSSAELAKRMNIANSTFRNLLSGAYIKLEVRTRAAAIAKARQMGLLPDESGFILPGG